MKGAWKLTIDSEWIAWLVFDAPGAKVNVLSAVTMAELDALLDQLAENEEIKAVAIRSGKEGNFIAGADIDELVKLKDEAEARSKALAGQRVFGKLAALPVPTVAVIHGSCMGGGMELALACDYRLVTDDPATMLGQPEVNLGIIPGWGGTQRLPRLIGLLSALPIILTGKPVSGRKAFRIGLADGIIANAFADEETQKFVNRVLRRRERRAIINRRARVQRTVARLLSQTSVGRRLILHGARKQVMAKTNGSYPAPLAALEVVRTTYARKPLPRGLKIEADSFANLACTPISRNLVWLFQASRRLKKGHRRSSNGGEATTERAAVVGGGVMGGGIAWALSHAGIDVRLHDVGWAAVSRGMQAASTMYGALVKRRKMTSREQALAMHRIGGTIDYTGFANTEFVIEAVIEDLDVKTTVLREIEARVPPETIIATNTSSLSLRELSSVLERPQRFIGLHFFNPVNRMPLVEVIPGPRTSRRTIVEAAGLVRRMGKTPVVVGDCAGFLVNRILVPYMVESAWMFEEGIDAERIDRVLQRFGMPMGPLTLVDEVGIDVGYKVAKVLESAYGPRMRVASALERVAHSSDWMGKKSGRGIYRYDNGHKTLNHDLDDLVEQARQADGVALSELTDEQIVDRAILIMVNEAARCLEDGVVDDPETLDLAMVMGTGFAPFRGGLLKYADERGLPQIMDALEQLAEQFGDRFQPASLIEKLARKSGTFYHSNGSAH